MRISVAPLPYRKVLSNRLVSALPRRGVGVHGNVTGLAGYPYGIRVELFPDPEDGIFQVLPAGGFSREVLVVLGKLELAADLVDGLPLLLKERCQSGVVAPLPPAVCCSDHRGELVEDIVPGDAPDQLEFLLVKTRSPS